MALNQIPALPENYPLFDWAEYQSSRDALAKGTPTAQFAKSAWNALVDDLADALAESGLEWDETYTTADGARMTDTDGQLSAAKFNSVRLNIDHPAPLGWAWERKPDFRGYLGRVEMRGAATHGRRCDVVYPEYIIELARKLNVLLEIMRGSALLADAECGLLLGVAQEVELHAQKSAPIALNHRAETTVSTDMRSQPAALLGAEQKSATQVQPSITSLPAANIRANTLHHTEISVDAASLHSSPVNVAVSASMLVKVDGTSGCATSIIMKQRVISNVSVEAEAVPIGRVLPADSNVLMGSAASIDMGSGAAMGTVADLYAVSGVAVEMDVSNPLPTDCESISGSAVSAEADKLPTVPMQSDVLTGTAISAVAASAKAPAVEWEFLPITNVSCRLDTAWYPPVWVDGGLWIRQSHNVTQNENGELVIM